MIFGNQILDDGYIPDIAGNADDIRMRQKQTPQHGIFRLIDRKLTDFREYTGFFRARLQRVNCEIGMNIFCVDRSQNNFHNTSNLSPCFLFAYLLYYHILVGKYTAIPPKT